MEEYSMEAVISMNPTIWVFAAILILLVLVQSALFLRLALRFNKKNLLVSRQEINSAVRTGAVAAIGPSLNSIVVALSLIAMVGSATTFMRCGVIGAPLWELYMANIAASAAGVTFGSTEFTKSVMTLCLFCMVFGSAPYFINTIVMLKPLDKAVEKSKAKKAKLSFMPYMGTAAMMGLLGYSVMDYISKTSNIVAGITSGIVCFAISKLATKIKNPTLASFNLAIGMVAGMVAGQLCVSIFG